MHAQKNLDGAIAHFQMALAIDPEYALAHSNLGVALVRKDDRLFQLRNELHCPVENDARNLHQELADEVAPDVARFIERLLAHKVDIPKKEEAPSAAPVAPRPSGSDRSRG